MNESVLKEIIEQSLAGYWDWNIPTGYNYLSPTFKKILGYEDHEIPNHENSRRKLIFEEDLQCALKHLKEHVESKCRIPFHIEVRFRHKNGSIVWVISTGKIIEWDEKGNPVRMVGCHIDITKRKQAEQALRDSEERFHILFEKAPLGYQSLDFDGNFIDINTAWVDTLGYSREEVIGKWFGDFLAPEYVQAFKERFPVFKSEGRIHKEFHMIHKDGSRRYIALDGSIGYNSDGSFRQIHCILKDETEQKKLEEALRSSEESMQIRQRLESLGILAGGIAHDFNNLLGGIFGYIEVAKDASTEKNVSNYLSKALDTIERARGLTGQLLTFAKGGTPIKKLEQLTPFIEETTRFALSGSSISVKFSIAPDLSQCEFDKNQISQVIGNMVINAAQAMSGGGLLEVSAENVDFIKNRHARLQPGNYVKITFKDHGIGIPKDVLSKIFNPFFSTKQKGHGLGLATCYSIIDRHCGCIEVDSEPGKGSVFSFFLPATLENKPVGSADQAYSVHKKSGTFVIMDDEEVIRETIGAILESLGYSIKFTIDGKETVEFFMSEKNSNREIAGAIFDLTIPGGLGGRETIGRIRKFDNKTPIYVASGYADDPVMSNPVDYGFNGSICKPFRKSGLIELLKRQRVNI